MTEDKRMEIVIDKNITVVCRINNNCSMDELLGVADVIKKIKRVVEPVNNVSKLIGDKQRKAWGFWNENNINEFMRLKLANMSPMDIATKMGCSRVMVYSIIKKMKSQGKLQ
jgi:hypothetical protein